jgi:uncharacterized protein YqgV (UPF0045/DUF77 family)
VRIKVEFTVEPFVEGAPGPHVVAAIAQVRARGLDIEIGPFANTIEGDYYLVLKALDPLITAALANGATAVTFAVEPISGHVMSADALESVLNAEHVAADRLTDVINAVEVEMGGELHTLSRVEKQKAARLLEERGAFRFRGAVENVADAMGVSRVTVYNYLNAVRRR